MRESTQWIITLITAPIIVIFGISFFVQAAESAHAPPAPPKFDTSSLKPENIVTFANNSVACVSLDDYDKIATYVARKEITKAETMVDNSSCLVLKNNEKFKVISIKDGVTQSFVEIIKANSYNGDDSLWTDEASINNIIKD